MRPKHYDDNMARHEGWVLSERDDGRWEIQRYDELPCWRYDRTFSQLEPPFKNDDEAEAYVRRQQFSPMHSEAARLHGTKVK